jgi:hypothetical protein
LGDGVPKLAPGGPPWGGTYTPSPNWGRTPERRRGAIIYNLTPTQRKNTEERHGAIARKLGLKTPKKA